jgi:hypothetical protein
VATDPPAVSNGKITFDEYQLETVDQSHDELCDLKGGEMFLPTEEFLIAWSHRCHEVVKVHDGVNERVEKNKKSGVSSEDESGPRPSVDHNQSVMDDVKRRYLTELLAKNKEERVD